MSSVQGLPPLRWNDGIARIAREHAEQMASGAAPFSPIAATGSTGFVRKRPFLTYGEINVISGLTEMARNLNIRQAERKKCGIMAFFVLLYFEAGL